MKHKIIMALMVFSLLLSCKQNKTFVISGTVSDFNGQAIDSATVYLKNKSFENLYEALSDENGQYSMEVAEGDYYCLYAIKLPDYRVRALEYWTWNVPVHENLTINPQYDKMEIYGINVFEPQVGPFETYMIYFRPMSLAKGFELVAQQNIDKEKFEKAKQAEKLLDRSAQVIDIAPDSISAEELHIEINGEKAEIVGITKMEEYARKSRIYAYVVQVIKPKANAENTEYDFVSLTLKSKETGEMGKAEAFVKRQ